MNSFWKFLNSNFFLLILGFCLTTVLGTYISDRIQHQSWKKEMQLEKKRQYAKWKRNKKFEILKRKLDNGQEALEDISDIINLRFFRLHNVFVSIKNRNPAAANKNWKDYYEVVEDWNVKLIINQNKIKRLVNEKEARLFNNYETDISNIKDPKSIHGKFYVAHKKVLSLLNCLRDNNCSISQAKEENVNNLLRKLDFQTDSFIDRISNLYIKKTVKLETFEFNENE